MTNPYEPPHASAPSPYAPPPGPYLPAPPGFGAPPGPRLHTANGVALATFLGAPLGGALVLADNERRLGRTGTAALTVVLGLVATALLIGVAFLLPAIGSPIPIVSILVMRQLAIARLKTAPPAPPGLPLSAWLSAAAGAVALGFLAVVVVAGALVVTLVHPDKVAFPPADEVYFEDGATEAEARAVGEALERAHFFGAPEGKMVTLTKVPSGLAVSVILQDGAWSSDETVHTFESFGRSLSEEAFHDPKRIVEVRLCNEWTMTKRTVSLK